MKKINAQAIKAIIFNLIAFSGLFFFQCKNETSQTEDFIVNNASVGFTKITGIVLNRDVYPDSKEITINIPNVSGSNKGTQIKAYLNDDGAFNFEIYLARPQDVTMQPYIDFLYLIPGDSLHIEFDNKDIQKVLFSGGKSADVNRDFCNYFNATGYRTTSHGNYGVGTNCQMNCSWDEIRKKLDEKRNVIREWRQSFLQKTDVSDKVVFLTEAMIELDYYDELVGTWMFRNRMGKQDMDAQALMNELNEVANKYFNSGFYSTTHFSFINFAYMRAAFSLIQKSDEDNDEDVTDWIMDFPTTETIRDFMLTVSAGTMLRLKELDNFEKFSMHVKNEYLLDRLMQEYSVTRANMVNPENLSSMLLGKPNDLSNQISLDNHNILTPIITQNAGNVQIINISATWCQPCKTVLEQLGALMKEYADKNVSFSFICVTPGNEEGRNKYRDSGIDDSCVHFITDDQYYFLAKTFSPIGFPYGILVNKKGAIVDYGGHVRPDMKLREKIDLLLEQDNLIK